MNKKAVVAVVVTKPFKSLSAQVWRSDGRAGKVREYVDLSSSSAGRLRRLFRQLGSKVVFAPYVSVSRETYQRMVARRRGRSLDYLSTSSGVGRNV